MPKNSTHCCVNSLTTRGPGPAANSKSSSGFTFMEMLYNDGSVHWEGPSGPSWPAFLVEGVDPGAMGAGTESPWWGTGDINTRNTFFAPAPHAGRRSGPASRRRVPRDRRSQSPRRVHHGGRNSHCFSLFIRERLSSNCACVESTIPARQDSLAGGSCQESIGAPSGPVISIRHKL